MLLDLLSLTVRRPSKFCLQPRCKTLTRSTFVRDTSNNSISQFRSKSLPPSSKPTYRTEAAAPKSPPQKAPNAVPLRMLLDRNPTNRSTISQIPIPKGERGENFTPSSLSRPVGLPYAPLPGQNVPRSERSWHERRTAYLDPNGVQARRRLLVRNFLRPYYQEWKRLDNWKGKTFVANERLFRRERALWFPNLWGWTLAADGAGGKDTTPLLKGKVSLVGFQSGVWAEEQVRTFLGDDTNPELKAMVDANRAHVQKVEVNIQDRWFRALLVKMFKARLRKMRPESDWKRYFSVRLGRDTGAGLTEDIRDAMGLLNSQVGYVYLLDTDCRIRWAGSGHAWEGEIKSLNAGVQRLIRDAKEPSKAPSETRPVPSRAETVREGDLREEVDRALA